MWHDSDIRFHINAETVRNTSRQDIHRYEQREAWKSSKFRRKYPFVYRVSQFYDISWRTLEKVRSVIRIITRYHMDHALSHISHHVIHDMMSISNAFQSRPFLRWCAAWASEWENEATFAGDGCMRFACQFFGRRKHKNLCSSSYKYKSKRKRLWRYF